MPTTFSFIRTQRMLSILRMLQEQQDYPYRLHKNMPKLSMSSLYALLHHMEGRGLIKGRSVTPESAPTRTMYSITPKGKRFLHKEGDVTQAVEKKIQECLSLYKQLRILHNT